MRSAAQAEHIPADESRSGRERDVGVDAGARAVVKDRLLRQPLDARSLVRPDRCALARFRADRAVPLGGRGRGEQNVRCGARIDIDDELVAARDPARRMDEDGVTDPIAFGIERLLHDERPVVTARCEHRPAPATLVAQRELRAPASNVNGIGEAH
jgi:hypothetical protein